MDVGIKYCGGCNPRYNRSEWVKQLMLECPDDQIEMAKSGHRYDVLLAVCGCRSACANLTGLHYKRLVMIDCERKDLFLEAVKESRG